MAKHGVGPKLCSPIRRPLYGGRNRNNDPHVHDRNGGGPTGTAYVRSTAFTGSGLCRIEFHQLALPPTPHNDHCSRSDGSSANTTLYIERVVSGFMTVMSWPRRIGSTPCRASLVRDSDYLVA